MQHGYTPLNLSCFFPFVFIQLPVGHFDERIKASSVIFRAAHAHMESVGHLIFCIVLPEELDNRPPWNAVIVEESLLSVL